MLSPSPRIYCDLPRRKKRAPVPEFCKENAVLRTPGTVVGALVATIAATRKVYSEPMETILPCLQPRLNSRNLLGPHGSP